MEMKRYKVVYEPFQTSSATSEIEMTGKDENAVLQDFRREYPTANLLGIKPL